MPSLLHALCGDLTIVIAGIVETETTGWIHHLST